MRTTITLDEDAFEIVKHHAESRSIGIGRAVNELVRRGARYRIPVTVENGLLVFDPPGDSPVVTMEQVKRLEDEDDERYFIGR